MGKQGITTSGPSTGRSSSKAGDDAFVVDSGGSPAVGAPWENQQVTHSEHCFGSDELEAPPEGKSPEFVQRSHKSSG